MRIRPATRGDAGPHRRHQPQGLDKAKLDVDTNEAGLASTKAQLEVRRSERASVAARLTEPTGESATSPPVASSCARQ